MKFETADTVISVNATSLAQLLTDIRHRLVARTGFAVATLNLDHLVKLRKSKPFRSAYAAQDFVTADGNPIVWLSRVADRPVDLVPGSDLVVPLCRLATELGVPVAFLGTTAEALDKAHAALAEQVPGLNVRLKIAPPLGYDPQGEMAEADLHRLRSENIGLCLLCLGAPKQEILAARGRDLAPETGFVSIGAGLDFFAGTQVRAPVWMRRLALEWVWRMLRNPRRMVGRYISCAAILPAEWRAARRLRIGARTAP